MYYLLACRDCGDPGDLAPVPFGSAADRGRRASAHARATGHDRWLVRDEAEEGGGVLVTSPELPGLRLSFSGPGEARGWAGRALGSFADLGVTIEERVISSSE